MDRDSLQINFGDVDDMRAKLPRAREIQKRVQRDADFWRQLVETLESRLSDIEADATEPVREYVEPEEAQVPDDASSDVLELVVGVVNEEGRPIRALEVANILRRRGHAFENATVSNSLHYAAKRAKPARVLKMPQRGVYAPLGTLPPELRPSSESNGHESSLIAEGLRSLGSQEMASAAGVHSSPEPGVHSLGAVG